MKNERKAARGLPAWLDGSTVAIIGTVCTVGLGVAATNLASTSALRTDVNARFNGVNARFDGVNARFDGVNARIDGVDASVNARIDGVNARIDATRLELGSRIDGLDARLRGVEIGIAEIRGRLRLQGPVLPDDGAPETKPPPPKGPDENRAPNGKVLDPIETRDAAGASS